MQSRLRATRPPIVLGRPVEIKLEALPITELENEIARARVMDAVLTHLRDVGGAEAGFSFDLSFDLSWGKLEQAIER